MISPRGLGVAKLRDATLADLASHGETMEPNVLRRARHIISEIERTTVAAENIVREDWPAVGAAMYASHASLRDDFEVSCAELDLLVDLAREIGAAGGVIGSRMTGGGFGGCTVTLVRTDSAEAVGERIRNRYREQTGIESTMFTTRPAAGAGALDLPAITRAESRLVPTFTSP